MYLSDSLNGTNPVLCNFGPPGDVKEHYIVSCFEGAKAARSVTIVNKYSGGVKLCDVNIFGKYIFELHGYLNEVL